ncbi:MAG: MBOAT family protein [Myxococcota bacterium]
MFVPLLALIAVWAWPRWRWLTIGGWALVPLLAAALFRPYAGPIVTVLELVLCVCSLRAIDGALNIPGVRRLELLRYALDLSRSIGVSAAPTRRSGLIRASRGALLLALGLLAGLWMRSAALWRQHGYLDDLAAVAVGGMLFTGLADIAIGSAWLLGSPVPDVHDARFPLSNGLVEFWGRRWNRSFGGTLSRVIFRARRMRRRPSLGVMLTFFVSGLAHALPMLVAFADLRASALLAGAAMLFFLLHGIGVLLESALPRRLRQGLAPRVLLWATWALTAPLYAPAILVAIGLLDRPLSTLPLL